MPENYTRGGLERFRSSTEDAARLGFKFRWDREHSVSEGNGGRGMELASDVH